MLSYQEHQQYSGKYLFIPEILKNSYNTLDNHHQTISLQQKDQSSASPASLALTQKNTKPTKNILSKSQNLGLVVVVLDLRTSLKRIVLH